MTAVLETRPGIQPCSSIVPDDRGPSTLELRSRSFRCSQDGRRFSEGVPKALLATREVGDKDGGSAFLVVQAKADAPRSR
jgi:hypothetical protein